MKKFFLAAFVPLIFCACLERNAKVEFNENDFEAMDVEYNWAVIVEPYAACRENPDYEAKVVRNLRKGSLEKVFGSKTVRTDGRAEVWFALEGGWVAESSVKVHTNRLRAEKAASEL